MLLVNDGSPFGNCSASHLDAGGHSDTGTANHGTFTNDWRCIKRFSSNFGSSSNNVDTLSALMLDIFCCVRVSIDLVFDNRLQYQGIGFYYYEFSGVKWCCCNYLSQSLPARPFSCYSVVTINNITISFQSSFLLFCFFFRMFSIFFDSFNNS